MHYVQIDRWSRGDSMLHRRDARAKLLSVLAVLITVAVTRPFGWLDAAAYGTLVLCGMMTTGLPVFALLKRAAVVLPFTATFAMLSAVAGDPERAMALMMKSYLSSMAVVLLVVTTPMPNLFHAASSVGTPRVLVLVLQFLYRYLFVIVEQAMHMRDAALSRGAALGTASRGERFRAAAGALAVLFARSYKKAEGIERSMVARGFDGRIHLLHAPRLAWQDAFLVILAAGTAIAIRVWM